MKAKYIFRWKDGNIEVWPSKAPTREEVWLWAETNLRGATETLAQGKRNVHQNGEVIELKTED